MLAEPDENTRHLTVRMTASEVVETSVTTTNNLSKTTLI